MANPGSSRESVGELEGVKHKFSKKLDVKKGETIVEYYLEQRSRGQSLQRVAISDGSLPKSQNCHNYAIVIFDPTRFRKISKKMIRVISRVISNTRVI